MICKAGDWTEIAVKNRIGLFSKMIGYIDDVNGSVIDENKEVGSTIEKVVDGEDKSFCKEKLKQIAMIDGNQLPDINEVDPKDFKALNFNSYEDGSTSVQIEHSLKGFSRRFNLGLDEAVKLAKVMDSTLEYASFRLKNRDLKLDEKGELFK